LSGQDLHLLKLGGEGQSIAGSVRFDLLCFEFCLIEPIIVDSGNKKKNHCVRFYHDTHFIRMAMERHFGPILDKLSARRLSRHYISGGRRKRDIFIPFLDSCRKLSARCRHSHSRTKGRAKHVCSHRESRPVCIDNSDSHRDVDSGLKYINSISLWRNALRCM
jgi:hypothetical protein